MSRQVILIGIDGGTFNLLIPWMKRGELQYLHELYNHGSKAVLLSTIPPTTPPAWTSICTGVNPGKHGLYGFQKRVGNTYSLKLPSLSDVRIPRIWDYVAAHGIKSIVVNYPVTYPPKIKNGVMVSGMFSASTSRGKIVYPKEYGRLIPPNYRVEVSWERYSPKETEKLLNLTTEMVEARKELTLSLMEEVEWEFLAVVFTAADRVSHLFWHMKGLILKVYQKIEEAIKEITHRSKSNVFIVSDHGFKGIKGVFRPNAWLMKEGYLETKRNVKAAALSITRGIGEKVLERIGALRLLNVVPRDLLREANVAYLSRIDWPRTKAFSLTREGIYINLKGREVKGSVTWEEYSRIVGEIASKLEKLRAPSGGKLVRKVFTKKEIFRGYSINQAPDIVYVPDEYAWDPQLGGEEFKKSRKNADHHIHGVFMAYGPEIKENYTVGILSVVDVAPTILHLLGLKIPKYMDGKVALDIFREGSEPATRVPERVPYSLLST